MRECLKDFDDYADLGQRSIDEIIALICRDLGLTPDWQRWVDASWAKQGDGGKAARLDLRRLAAATSTGPP
ncbi:MAG: hypothetical protein WCC64_12080 [Aliidongia sp.]